MSLAAIQRRFQSTVTEFEGNGVLDWPADMRDGLAVYRSAYRGRLLDCLRQTFEKCRQWIGDESFDAAAAHYLILHPPTSWTLDDLGAGFSDTLVDLFPADLEVAELAWLEWEMQRLFTLEDTDVLAPAEFATKVAAFSDSDWLDLGLSFVPCLTKRVIFTDCAALWNAIDQEAEMPSLDLLRSCTTMLVWRQDLRSQFRLLDGDEAVGLDLMRAGGSFEDLCAVLVDLSGEAYGVAAAGNMLGRWITNGLVSKLVVARR